SLATAADISALSDDALNPLKNLVARSEGTTASERSAKLFLVWSTRSDISEEMFSEIPLAPLKTLLAASEIGGASDRDLATPLFTTSEIIDARFSDVVRNPLNAVVTLSEIADTEFSELAPAPVNTLPTTSEGTTLRNGNFPAPLFMLSLNAEARLSAVPRNPWNSLVTLSDTADTEF